MVDENCKIATKEILKTNFRADFFGCFMWAVLIPKMKEIEFYWLRIAKEKKTLDSMMKYGYLNLMIWCVSKSKSKYPKIPILLFVVYHYKKS